MNKRRKIVTVCLLKCVEICHTFEIGLIFLDFLFPSLPALDSGHSQPKRAATCPLFTREHAHTHCTKEFFFFSAAVFSDKFSHFFSSNVFFYIHTYTCTYRGLIDCLIDNFTFNQLSLLSLVRCYLSYSYSLVKGNLSLHKGQRKIFSPMA